MDHETVPPTGGDADPDASWSSDDESAASMRPVDDDPAHLTDAEVGPDTQRGPADAPADAASARADVTRRRRRWRLDTPTLLALLVVTLGMGLVVRGLLVSITGDDRANLPPLVEEVNPVPEAVQVLSQSNVFVDLVTGYEGVLVIDGVEIPTVNVNDLADIEQVPGQQVELPPVTIFAPGNATLTFTPGAGAPIQQFDQGDHQAQVIYWKTQDGRQRARTFTWTFTVL
ncbi:MAG: hypothetical protein ABIO83_01795 [Ilumatobacteraceae bacterium]